MWHGIPQLIVSILNVNKWGEIKCFCKFSRLKKNYRAPLAPKLPVLTRSSLVWVGGSKGGGWGGGLVLGLTGKRPPWLS